MPAIVNMRDIKQLIGTEQLFKKIHNSYGKPPNWFRPPGFASLSRIILQQQVSLASANAHFLKLNTYLEEFTPSNILQLTDTEMRECQVSRQKAKYLRELSTGLLNKTIDLESLEQLEPEEIRRRLTSLKGIGNWTTDIYLMFCLQKKDILPVGDIAIVSTINELWGAMTRTEIIVLAKKWTPLRSLASYYLWHYYLSKRNRLG